jgi:hypothetical protein
VSFSWVDPPDPAAQDRNPWKRISIALRPLKWRLRRQAGPVEVAVGEDPDRRFAAKMPGHDR